MDEIFTYYSKNIFHTLKYSFFAVWTAKYIWVFFPAVCKIFSCLLLVISFLLEISCCCNFTASPKMRFSSIFDLFTMIVCCRLLLDDEGNIVEWSEALIRSLMMSPVLTCGGDVILQCFGLLLVFWMLVNGWVCW